MISLHNFTPWNRYVSLSLTQFTRKETQISLLKEIVIVYWEFVSRKSKNENKDIPDATSPFSKYILKMMTDSHESVKPMNIYTDARRRLQNL